MNALEIKDLCKTYPTFSLNHLNLTIPCGCIVGLIGENGAGKSTTMKLILDMIRKDSGSIQIFGKDNQTHLRALKEDIGVVLDEVGLSGCLTPIQIANIMRHTFQNWDDTAYQYYLSSLSLPKAKKFKEFSRGMKMKLASPLRFPTTRNSFCSMNVHPVWILSYGTKYWICSVNSPGTNPMQY